MMGNIKHAHSANPESAARMQFGERSFCKITAHIKHHLMALSHVLSVNAIILVDSTDVFESFVGDRYNNRSKSVLSLSMINGKSLFYECSSPVLRLTYTITGKQHSAGRVFVVSSDEDQFFWSVNSRLAGLHSAFEMTSENIAESIWKEWFEYIIEL